MIDLSFLTEEEQEAIMKVLQRDADLKKAEEERVRVLEETVDDTNELKNKTGQWFYEAKSKRHRDKIHGADLIRASIRKKKPQTIAELSQSRTDKAKKSWVNNVNKDIFIPPELFGVMEEPEKEEEEEKTHAQYYRSVPRVDNLSVDETNASFQKAVSSPSKQRRNPFNDAALDDDFLLTSENRLSENGSPRLQQIPGKGIMPPSRKSQSSKTFPKSESKEVSQTSSDAVDGSERHGEQIPKPKVRTVTYKIVDPQSDSDSSFPKPTKRTDSMNGTSARKGILKRSPSSSSTDSEILRISQTFDSQSKSVLPTTPIIEGEAEKNYVDDIPDESSQYSIDRLKQVRFTSADVQDELPLSPDTHKGKEIGEFHLLESDFGKNAMDNIDGFQYLHSELGSTENGMPVHPETIDLDGDVAVTVSEEKDGDATPYQSLSSSVDHNLIADVPQLEQTPSSSTIRIDSQSSTYELSQEKGSPPAVTTVRPPKEISVNINENGMPASELLIESDSTDLSNPELQPSKLTVDQQPIYATVKSPRVSKLDSSDIQQDQQPLHTEVKSPQVSKNNSTNHHEGKPSHVGDLSPDTPSKPDKYTIEFKKAADESISKVLAWFNRDSVTSGEKTNSINAPEKVFIEERDPSRKTETRAIVPENARPSAAELRLKSPIEERQTPSQSKHAKHFTSDAGTQCRKELLSFGIDKNIGGKSGNVDVHGDVDTENKVLEQKTLLQRAENRFKDSSGEQLLYGKSKSGGGKMCFGAESPASKIPEAKLSTTETVPTSHKKSEAERNLKSVNSSEINIEESLLENNANWVLSDKMPEDYFASPVAVRTDTEEIPKTEPSVPGVEDLQQDTMVYWRRPSILEQKEPMQQPKTLVDVESSGKKRLSDMKSFWEGDKAAARAPSAKPTFKESNKIDTLSTGLENIQVETKEEIKHQNEVPRSNITAVKSLWEDKANLAKPMPDKLTGGTGDKATKKQASSEKKSRVLLQSPKAEEKSSVILQSPKAEDLKRKELVDSIKNPDKLNAHDNFLGKDQSSDSQQKHNFKVLSFKERMHESPTEQLSNPAQFQSLRSFWNIEKKSPDKPEIKPYVGRRGTTLPDSKDSEFLELDKAVAQNTQDGFQAQDKKLSDFEESDYKRKEWRKNEAQGNKTVPDSLMQVHVSLPRDGITETVEKVSAPSKSEIDTFKISLERLGEEASEDQPASEREHVEEEKALRKAEVRALNTGLQKFGRENPETLMPLNQKILATVSSANDTRPGQGSFFERVRQRTNNDSQYYQKTKATQPQEVREIVEKAIAPRKTDSSEFKIGFEKLVKEASDVPSPFHQTADISEIVKNSGSTSKHFKQPDEKALPQEIQETIEKSAVPPKSDQNEFNVGLQKLLIEASVASPQSPETARNEDSVQKNIRPEQQSVFESVKYGRLNDSPGAPKVQNHQEEVQEMVSKMAAPEKVEFSAFNSGLEKLYKEASEYSPASYATTDAKEDIHTNISDQDQQSFYKGRKNLHETTGVSQNRMASPKEITKQSENASVASPETARNEDSVQQNVSRPEHLSVFESVNYGRLNDSPGVPTAQYHQEEVEEMVSKMAAPEKVEFIAFNSGLEKLYREASESSPTSYVTADAKEDIHTNISVQGQQLFNKGRKNLHETDGVSKNRMTSPREVTKQSGKASQPEQPVLSFQKVTPEQVSFTSQKGQFPPEVNEVVDKTVSLPKTETSAFNVGLEKLYQEGLDSSEPNKVGPLQNLSSQPEQEILSADLPVSIVYNSDVKVLVKKETSRQTDLEKHKEEISRDAYLAKESPFPEAPDRNVVFLQKTIHKSGPSASNQLPFGDENNSMSKTYRVKNVEHPRNEVSEVEVVADLDDHEYAAPDVNASGRFVRASTPVKERDSSVKSSAIELSVSSPRHENEDLSKSTDSDFSDGNTGPYAGSWRNSSRSEEELNPVLTALKRSSSKPMPSKSLEDISSASSKPGQVDLPREECVLSKEDDQKADQREPFYETIPGNSTVPSYRDNRFSDAEKMKRLSKSVPDFLQDDSDDRETDSTSEGSFQLSRLRKTPSSLTNLSGSSGMASLSSVSGSVMSIYSGDFGNVDIKGNIQFTIDYVDQLQEFHIFVAQCKDLAVADVKKQRSDPYVKSYLLPDKEKLGKRKTAVRKKTLNPAYNEILRYKISKQTLLTQKLNLSVWHHDTFGRNSFLGEVAVDLATFDWNNKQMSWYSLQPRTPAAGIGLENRGEINIALMYTSKPTFGKNTTSSGEVHIWVKSCSNLPMLRGNRINSFVKCTVLPDTSRKSRQKTRSVDKTVNPVFNHTMVYDGFRPEDLREACVELTVWDHNRLVNHFLGGLRLGLGSGKSYGTPVDWMDSTSYEASLWKKMINTPDEWVQDTLQLRMLMMAKMAK